VKRFALHPGLVKSATDGDVHVIGVTALARLYELRPHEYFEWTKWDDRFNRGSYIHLYPRKDGKYGRPAHD
jgi:hypothetical protein